MKKHLKIFIEGNLEAADFNYYCQSTAYKYGINAIYKNGDTRHVYLEAEGKDEELQSFAKELREGPLKRYTEIFRTEDGEFKNIKGFTSLRDKKQKKNILKKFKNLLS